MLRCRSDSMDIPSIFNDLINYLLFGGTLQDHYKKQAPLLFVVPKVFEGCLFTIFVIDLNLAIAGVQVNRRKLFSTCQTMQDIADTGKEVDIFSGDFSQSTKLRLFTLSERLKMTVDFPMIG